MERNIYEHNVELEKNLWELEKSQSSKKKFELILKLYSLFGLLAAFFSIIYFILITIDIELKQEQLMVLTIAGVGLTLSATSWALLLFKREKMIAETNKIKSIRYISEFIIKWTQFENSARNLFFPLEKDFNKYSISDIIEKLLITRVIDKADYLILEEAMKVRNLVLHSREIFPNHIFNFYSKRIDEIVSRILDKNQR